MIRVALVEDDPLFRDTVSAAIQANDEMVMTAVAANRREALAWFEGGLQPLADVLLVDLGLPDGSGIDVIQAATRHWPQCAVMVATMFGDEQRVLRSIEAGATGYLLKDATAERIVAEIRVLHAGGSPISPMIARRLLKQLRPDTPSPQPDGEDDAVRLSGRETQVLQLMAHGHTAGEAADVLGVSSSTVLTFIRRIYVKLGVSSKIAAINEARRRGLMPPEQAS